MFERASPDSRDPLDFDDPATLRREILQLRDTSFGENARAELLADRIDTLEAELHARDTHAQALQRTLDRSPLHRVRRILGRVRRSITGS